VAAGYRVSLVAGERFALGHWSRLPEEQIVLAGTKTDPEGYVERLSQVLRREKYDLVVPGTEWSLLPISERRGLIEPYARLGLPSHEVVLRALNKPLLQDQAAAVGLAPPTSVICSTDEEVLMIARELGFPLVVKPVRSVTWTTGRIRQHKAQIVGDENLLQAAVAAVEVPLTLQKFVSRPTIVSCAAVRVDGRLLGLTFARYARTFPPLVGSAALAVTIAPPQPLLQQVEELLELIGWCGIFELELLELGENRFGAIDFNPRPFGWMAPAIEAGANLPALWCDYALQRREISSKGARVGIHYRREDADIRYALAQLCSGHLRSAAAVLRPRRGVVHAYFRLDDPAPLVARLLSIAQRATRRTQGLVTPVGRMFALNSANHNRPSERGRL
jgi:predicted ATP-grasp superfamily ATP-dependent carboligase